MKNVQTPYFKTLAIHNYSALKFELQKSILRLHLPKFISTLLLSAVWIYAIKTLNTGRDQYVVLPFNTLSCNPYQKNE